MWGREREKECSTLVSGLGTVTLTLAQVARSGCQTSARRSCLKTANCRVNSFKMRNFLCFSFSLQMIRICIRIYNVYYICIKTARHHLTLLWIHFKYRAWVRSCCRHWGCCNSEARLCLCFWGLWLLLMIDSFHFPINGKFRLIVMPRIERICWRHNNNTNNNNSCHKSNNNKCLSCIQTDGN